MHRANVSAGLAAATILAAILATTTPTEGCAIAHARLTKVEIADESAIIIWDAAAKVEHFIRRASFKGNAADFGFLVPTPARPQLEEALDEAFDFLAKITAPRTETREAPKSSPGCGCTRAALFDAAAVKGSVQVLEEKRVGGFDAAVLQADDADALTKWLSEHGYEFAPALKEWMKPYVAKGWVITAFKISKDSPEKAGVATSAVRMTFAAERPFFPYREPASAVPEGDAHPNRLLRLYFVGGVKAGGELEAAAGAWPAKIPWANQLSKENRDRLLELLKLPANTGPETVWLTEFEDHSSPRPAGADVYFTAADNQHPIERPPNIVYASLRQTPNCAACYALVLCMLTPSLWRGRRDRR